MRYPVETNQTAERGQAFIAALGALWRELHGDREMFLQYGRLLGELLSQRLMDLTHLLLCLSRHTTPTTRLQRWKRICFLESELTTSEASKLRYGQGVVYGVNGADAKLYLYGGAGALSAGRLDIPENLKKLATLASSCLAPGLVLVEGTDYWIESDPVPALVFRENPFTLEGATITTLYDSAGAVADRECTFWAFGAEEDRRDMAERYGAVVGLGDSLSSRQFSDLVNAVFSLLTSGPSLAAVRDVVAALTDVPHASAGETVQDIATVGEFTHVVTNLGAYTFSANATILVTRGQVLRAGQAFCDAVVWVAGADRIREQLDGWTVDARHLDGLSGREALAFPNEDRTLQVTSRGGKTAAQVTLEGHGRLQARFWEQVHQRGVDAGTTLANLLDLREEPVGEPSASDLPPTLNPLGLLLSDIGHNVVLCTLRPAAFGPEALDVRMGLPLRQLLPARMALWLLVEHSLASEYIDLGDSDAGADEVSFDYALGDLLEDSLDPVDALTPGDPGVLDGGLRLTIPGGACP